MPFKFLLGRLRAASEDFLDFTGKEFRISIPTNGKTGEDHGEIALRIDIVGPEVPQRH
jgi:hypothetical protein